MKPTVFFWILAMLMVLVSFVVGDLTGFVNLYDTHVAVAQKDMAIWAGLIFFLVGLTYWMASKRHRLPSTKRLRLHIWFSLAGPLSTIPVMLFSRNIVYPITDLIQYAEDMQFNDRLLLICFGLWLITLLSQLIFTLLLFRTSSSKK
ncbi:MAG: hypothetical protein RLZZ241_472 [Bacteroidota bacterium]|jgi:hypothetical protein